MQYLYIFVMVVLSAILWQLCKKIQGGPAKGEKAFTEDDIKIFHVFPGYPKNQPLECRATPEKPEEFHFIVRGYTDKYQFEEVPIEADKVIWKHTEGNGKFKGNRNLKTGVYTGIEIDFIAPRPGIYTKEKMIFISAHYRDFTDATWIKILN